MSDPPKLRAGVIGCGQFMSRQHIPTIARSACLRLEHLADLDEPKLRGVAQRYAPQRCSADWRRVVDDANVDLVVVGVRPEFHPQIARAALEQGKPVYVEKPLAPTPEECLEIQQLADRVRLPVAVGFNRRFAPATAVLRQAFRSAAGPISVVYRTSDDDRVRPPDQQWKRGDRLLLEAVHIFDFLAYLLAAEPLAVFAREARPNDALVTIDFAGGSRAVVWSSSLGSLAQPKERLEAMLDYGAIEMDDFVEIRTYGLPGLPRVSRFAGRPYDDCDNGHVEDFARRGREALLELRQRYDEALRRSGVLTENSPTAWARARELLGVPPPPQINYASDKGWGRALEEFALAIREGRTPRNATAADGNRATACAVAARQSIRSGQVVPLDPRTWGVARD